MMRTGLQRIEENVKFLKSVPLLKNLDNSVLSKIADVLELVRSTCNPPDEIPKLPKEILISNLIYLEFKHPVPLDSLDAHFLFSFSRSPSSNEEQGPLLNVCLFI